MIATMRQKEFDIDFDAELPPNMAFFPLWWLAKRWHCSVQHVINLVDSGELKVPVDLKGKSASKSMIRAPRVMR